MRRLLTFGAISVAFLVTAASVEAQNPDGASRSASVRSSDSGTGLLSSHPDPMDPKGGTVLVKLEPVGAASPDARGHAVFNYLKSQETYLVQVNVQGLEPQTWYQIHLAVASVEERADLGTFRTDSEGDGDAHLQVSEMPTFNIVNIRRPGVSGSRVLTSWQEDGGSLEETPSRRTR